MLDNKELIMKNWYIYLLCILVSSNFFACQDDDLEDQSIFDVSEKEKSEFDRWLLENYVNPYNIDFKYRMEHIESCLLYTSPSPRD